MNGEENPAEMYVHKVHEDTRRFAQDLLGENEKLRVMVAMAQNEKHRLEENLLSIREELGRRQENEDHLKRQMAVIEEANSQFSKKYLDVEQQNSNLANLYVASYRLHGTLNHKEVLSTIQEIIINLVGSEELGIFESDANKSMLFLSASVGIDTGRYQSIPVGTGLIGYVALTGKPYLLGKSDRNPSLPEEPNLTACIPLKVEGRVTGAIAIFRLLQQKQRFEALDYELFDILATHAAMALYCTNLHKKEIAAVSEIG